MNEVEKIKCPCCGQVFVEEYDICDKCDWENDPIQLANPDFKGGANQMSLKQAQYAFAVGVKVK